MIEVKQVILIRKDLKMGKGKIASQASHACMKVFFDELYKFSHTRLNYKTVVENGIIVDSSSFYDVVDLNNCYLLRKKSYFDEYINGAFKKVVLAVNSEEELKKYYEIAKEKDINCSIILDSGKTEFDNVPTYTSVAIGPWEAKEIDKITGHLKLL
jgi:PTH2 family peptidyl-tRNA hydrolase